MHLEDRVVRLRPVRRDAGSRPADPFQRERPVGLAPEERPVGPAPERARPWGMTTAPRRDHAPRLDVDRPAAPLARARRPAERPRAALPNARPPFLRSPRPD